VTVFSDPVELASAAVPANGSVNVTAALPSNLSAGTHTVVVSGTGASGQEVKTLTAFKVDDSGRVTDVGKPGDGVGVIPDGSQVERSLALGEPVYSPSAHPGTVAAVAVTGAAVVGVAGAAAGAAAGASGSAGAAAGAARAAGHAATGASAASHGATASMHADGGHDAHAGHVFETEELVFAVDAAIVGLGDRSPTWRAPGTQAVHSTLARLTMATGRYSIILPRVLSDGTWARAMFGTNALLLWVAGFVVGLVSLIQSGFTVIPGSITIILAIIILGLLDAMAGFIAWATMTLGALVTLHVRSLQDVLTIFGLGLLAFSLTLFAHYLRPLRRVGHSGLVGLWDRFADYVIPPVIIAFSAAAMAKGLNGLSGLEIVNTEDVVIIELVAGASIVVRMALEDVTRKLYPQRCAEAAMPKPPLPPTAWRLAAIGCRTVLTYLVFAAFVGNSWMPAAAATILSIPLVLGVYHSEIPTVPGFHRWLPKGITELTLTTIIGGLIALYLFKASIVEGLLPGLLVLLMIPSALLAIMHAFADHRPAWKNVWPKRLLGVPVYILMVSLTTGVIALGH
jgi:hypothetical protein